MRGRLTAILLLGCGVLCGGASAAARGGGASPAARNGGSEMPRIRMTSGCLDIGRVTVRILPREGTTLGPVHIRAVGHEAVHLNGVTQKAAVILRVPAGGRVMVSGETDGGTRFRAGRTYHRCAPQPATSPGASGGGEG